jgi:thioredoxin 1
MDKMCREMKDIVFAKIDVDEQPEIADKNDVSAVPTFVFYKAGYKVGEYKGSNEAALRAAIESHHE